MLNIQIVYGKVAIPRVFGPTQGRGKLLGVLGDGIPLGIFELVVQRAATQVGGGTLFVRRQILKGLGMVGNFLGGVPG